MKKQPIQGDKALALDTCRHVFNGIRHSIPTNVRPLIAEVCVTRDYFDVNCETQGPRMNIVYHLTVVNSPKFPSPRMTTED